MDKYETLVEFNKRSNLKELELPPFTKKRLMEAVDHLKEWNVDFSYSTKTVTRLKNSVVREAAYTHLDALYSVYLDSLEGGKVGSVEWQNKPTYLYLLKLKGLQGTKVYCKVGISINPKQRIKDLNSAFPQRVFSWEIHKSVQFPDRTTAFMTEQAIHILLTNLGHTPDLDFQKVTKDGFTEIFEYQEWMDNLVTKV